MRKLIRSASLILAAMMVLSCFSLPARAEKNSGVVRVLLTKAALTNQVKIALDGSYTLGDISFQRGSQVTVSIFKGLLMVYYEGIALNAGKEAVFLRHETDEGLENGFRLNGGYDLHPGDLHLTIQNGALQAVLYAPVEDYLLGVVPYEMSDSFPLEALKAQAVAARTYALRKALSSGAYDLVDNTNDQSYNGVRKENKNAARAVEETRGVCGYYKDALAECFYSASNGGQTELVSHVWGRGDYAYLTMQDDPYDLENPESVVKSGRLQKSLSSNDDLGALKEAVLGALSELMESRGYDGDAEYIRVTAIEGANTAIPLYFDSPSKIMTLLRLELKVMGRRLLTENEEEEVSLFTVFESENPLSTAAPKEEGKEEWSAMETLTEPVTVTLDLFPLVESALNLSINAGANEIITLRETPDAFYLEARRFGHGVGMSQRGAQRMAGNYGWTCEQILRFYYPGMELKTISYTFQLPPKLSAEFLATPGPAATPSPRPTVMPVFSTPSPREYKVQVTNIGVNSYLNLRQQPNTQAGVLRQLYYGQELIVMDEKDDWLTVRTDDMTGYVMKEFVTRVEEQ